MAPALDKDYVLKTVEERGIRFVRFWFTDVLGFLKSFAVTDSEIEAAFDEGMGFDGSSIDGFTRIQESDMVAFPNADTFQILPWRPGENGVARMFTDVVTPDGKPTPSIVQRPWMGVGWANARSLVSNQRHVEA